MSTQTYNNSKVTDSLAMIISRAKEYTQKSKAVKVSSYQTTLHRSGSFKFSVMGIGFYYDNFVHRDVDLKRLREELAEHGVITIDANILANPSNDDNGKYDTEELVEIIAADTKNLTNIKAVNSVLIHACITASEKLNMLTNDEDYNRDLIHEVQTMLNAAVKQDDARDYKQEYSDLLDKMMEVRANAFNLVKTLGLDTNMDVSNTF